MKKNRVSLRKSKRRKGGHLLAGMGFSLTRTTFDNGCGCGPTRQQPRNHRNREAITDGW
jgi:hypothetical protein